MPAHWRFHHQAVRHSAAAPSVSSLVVAIRCYEFGIVVIKAVVVARRHRIVATFDATRVLPLSRPHVCRVAPTSPLSEDVRHHPFLAFGLSRDSLNSYLPRYLGSLLTFTARYIVGFSVSCI
ncbi:hypothetical protein KC323_g130 [Hortaea werneckii]|nr:hypothetical protein KC323_g130 [Hortaea werneckii]